MLRDNLKDSTYFQKYIEEELDDVKYYRDSLEQGKVKEDRIFNVKRQINNKMFLVFEAKYSMGDVLDEVAAEFKSYIKDFPDYWNPVGGYVQMLWNLSICVLLDDKQNFSSLVQQVESKKMSDYLTDWLISTQTNIHKNDSKFLFPSPYESLREVIVIASGNKNKAMERLKFYLEKEWYKGHSDTGWYDSHKSKVNIYSAYWSWESGALVKILGLDDSSLKDQQYYPYDMVHWNE